MTAPRVVPAFDEIEDCQTCLDLRAEPPTIETRTRVSRRSSRRERCRRHRRRCPSTAGRSPPRSACRTPPTCTRRNRVEPESATFIMGVLCRYPPRDCYRDASKAVNRPRKRVNSTSNVRRQPSCSVPSHVKQISSTRTRVARSPRGMTTRRTRMLSATSRTRIPVRHEVRAVRERDRLHRKALRAVHFPPPPGLSPVVRANVDCPRPAIGGDALERHALPRAGPERR